MKVFQNIKIGKSFIYGGNKWIKQSTRTALLLYCDRWFYFSKNDYCKEVKK